MRYTLYSNFVICFECNSCIFSIIYFSLILISFILFIQWVLIIFTFSTIISIQWKSFQNMIRKRYHLVVSALYVYLRRATVDLYILLFSMRTQFVYFSFPNRGSNWLFFVYIGILFFFPFRWICTDTDSR